MNEWRSEERKWCYFHPRESVVGICAVCLKEKLNLLLAANSNYNSNSKKNSLLKTSTNFTLTTNNKSPSSSSSLTKIFALTTLLNRLDIKDHQKSSAQDHHFSRTSSSTPDDSFISIKFEDNGIGSWDKGKVAEMSHDRQCEMSYNDKKIKSLVEHSKPRAAALRWRRRIGHIFQLIRLKRSNKGNICHVGTKHRKSKTLSTIEKL